MTNPTWAGWIDENERRGAVDEQNARTVKATMEIVDATAEIVGMNRHDTMLAMLLAQSLFIVEDLKKSADR